MVVAVRMVLCLGADLFLLRRSSRHIHGAPPYTKQNWEGRVQEIGPDPPQAAVVIGAGSKGGLSARQAVGLLQPWPPVGRV